MRPGKFFSATVVDEGGTNERVVKARLLEPPKSRPFKIVRSKGNRRAVVFEIVRPKDKRRAVVFEIIRPKGKRRVAVFEIVRPKGKRRVAVFETVRPNDDSSPARHHGTNVMVT